MEDEPMGEDPDQGDEPTRIEPTRIEPERPQPPPKSEATVALVPAVESAPDEWERGLEPRCMADAVRLAQRMHDSRMFSAYGTPHRLF